MFNCFNFLCHNVVPLVYTNDLTVMEIIHNIICHVNKLLEDNKTTEEILKEYGLQIKDLQADVNELQIEFDKIKNGEYMDGYIEALSKWIDANLTTLVSRIVKYVFFGLTDDGHFCAYIPDSWDFIEFDTIIDTNNDFWGHLLVRW